MRLRSWGALGAFAVLAALMCIPASGAYRVLGDNDRTATTRQDIVQYIVRLERPGRRL